MQAVAALAALTHLDVDVVGVTAASAEAVVPALVLLQPRLTAARVWAQGKELAARVLAELAPLAACGVAVQTHSWSRD